MQVEYRQDIVPMWEIMVRQEIVPSSELGGEVVVAVVDDLAIKGDDDDLLGADFDDGGDVLMGLVLGDDHVFAEQVDSAVRADKTDHLDTALGRKPSRSDVAVRERVA